MRNAKYVITVNGLHVGYYRYGSGPPLLFLHGGRVRARTFKRLLALLAERYTVIAPDIPGFGESDTPHDVWSFANYAVFFDAFLSTLNAEAVTLVGYSMGGGIAANLASECSRIKNLTLIDASGIYRVGSKRNYHDGRRLWFYLGHPQYITSLGVLVRDYVQYLWKHKRDWTHMQAIRRACFETSYDESLQRISVPVRLLWGNSDWIYPLSVAQLFQRLIPRATLETVPGNHDWPVYNPSLIRRHMI